MAKEENKLMYSTKDIDVIKRVFAENDEFLVVIRKLFFGLDISDADKTAIRETFKNQDVRDVFQRKVYGLNNFDTPVGQISDFWLGVEKQIFGASRDTIQQTVESKTLVFNMFEKAMKLLQNPDGERVDVTFMPNLISDPLQVGLLARNLYMQAIETSLLTLKSIAGMKQETTEQAEARLKQESNK